MFKRKSIISIIKVAFGNVVALFAGIISGFILPKIMDLTNYGYYKTFSLYISYLSLLNLGVLDGLLLCFGDKDYEQLNKKQFRFYSKFFLFVFCVPVVIGIASGFIFFSGEFRYIIIFLSICLWCVNITTYYQYISQATRRFNEISLRNILRGILLVLIILILVLVYLISKKLIDYKLYLLLFSIITFFLALWYIYTYREITFGESNSIYEEKDNLLKYLKLGFPLMMSNFCAVLILNLDRQIVNIFFSKDEYATYAFSYNLINLVITTLSAISTVLFPLLKREDEENLKNSYCNLLSIIIILSTALFALYFPLDMFISWFLPNYSFSLTIFKIICPSIGVICCTTIVIQNYYKVTGKVNVFFKKSLWIIILSLSFNVFVYCVFKTMEAISISSAISLFCWYIVSSRYFEKKYNIKNIKNTIFLLLLIIIFYLISFLIFNKILGFIIYCLCFLLLVTIFNFKKIKNIFLSQRRGGKNEEIKKKS